jgi:hypothetical protein
MLPLKLTVATLCVVMAAAAQVPQNQDSFFQIRYAINLDQFDAGITITNTGANGAPLLGPGFGTPTGNLCVNVYAFSPDEQLVSCCSCLITPNGLASLSVKNDILSNTLTGVQPAAAVIKLVSTGAGADFHGTSCTNSATMAGSSAFPLANGMLAWGTTIHTIVPGTPLLEGSAFSNATLNGGELSSITNRCNSIVANGSTFGICRSCQPGGGRRL